MHDTESDDCLVADVFDRNCPSRSTMTDVAGRWGSLALLALRDGEVRFNALRRRVDGVSDKMLSQTLQSLQRDGMITREVRATIPPARRLLAHPTRRRGCRAPAVACGSRRGFDAGRPRCPHRLRRPRYLGTLTPALTDGATAD